MNSCRKDQQFGASSSKPLKVIIIGECLPGQGRGCTEPSRVPPASEVRNQAGPGPAFLYN